MRPSERDYAELRPIKFTRQFTNYAEGSVLVEFGATKVLCTASLISGVPRFLKDAQQGWLTAEYGMLPRSTHERIEREAVRGKQNGRTIEIQRLIGRSLRAALDLKALGDYTIAIDCDVLQADGGTRTAAISGSCVALADALKQLQRKKNIKNPLRMMVAAVSVGIYQQQPIIDLDYAEDSVAETDMNVVMTEEGQFIEVQGTAEKRGFGQQELDEMLLLAKKGIEQIISLQKQVLQD